MQISLAISPCNAAAAAPDAPAFAVSLTGLTDAEARIGDHAAIGYSLDSDHGTIGHRWGTTAGDDTYGTGYAPSDLMAGDGGALVFTVTAAPGAEFRNPADVTGPELSDTTDPGVIETFSGAIVARQTGALTVGETYVITYHIVSNSTGRTLFLPGNSGFFFVAIDDAITPGWHRVEGIVQDTDVDAFLRANGTGGDLEIDYVSMKLKDAGTFPAVSGTMSVSAPIRHAPGSAPAIALQTLVVDDDPVSVSAAATGANLTFSHTLTNAPGGAQIDSATGEITVTGNGGAFPDSSVGSGVMQVTATDQYGREVGPYDVPYEIVLRAAATAAGGLSDQTITNNSGVQTYDASGDFTANGNTLTYSVNAVAGVTINASTGVVGHDTDAMETQSGTSIVVTATDEYGRMASSGYSLAITASTGLGTPTLSSVSITDDGGGNGSMTLNFDTGEVDGTAIVVWGYIDTPADADPANGAAVAAGTGAEATFGPISTTVGATGVTVPVSGTIQGTFDVFVTASYDDGATYSNVVSASGVAFDTTAPTLSGLSGTQTGDTTATAAVTSNEAGGTIHFGVRPTAAAALTSAQLIAGSGGAGVAWASDTTPTADGDNAAAFTGLTASTAYRVDAVHVDASGNAGLVVSSAEFTTAAMPSGVTFTDDFSTDTSADYTRVDNTANLVVSGGVASQDGTGDARYTGMRGLGAAADHTASIVVADPSAFARVITRYTDADNKIAATWNGSNQVRLERWVGGTYANATFDTFGYISNGDTLEVQISASGTSATLRRIRSGMPDVALTGFDVSGVPSGGDSGFEIRGSATLDTFTVVDT